MTTTIYQPGDRIFWWFDTGMGVRGVAATIVRINRRTITVRNDYGEQFRIDPVTIDGFVDWEN